MWDLIIVGSGVGGATLGHALSAAGRNRILFIEKGLDLRHGAGQRGLFSEQMSSFGRHRDESLRQSGRMTETVDDALRGDAFVPYLGAGTGGSSALFGMAMERMFPRDLDGKWPIGAAEFEPWYEAAERLYRVQGTPDPLRDESSALIEPGQLSAANAPVFAELERQGLHPYRLHVARENAEHCGQCQGFLCPKPCKNDAQRICLEPALREPGVSLMANTVVERVEADGRRVTTVIARQDGQAVRLKGRHVILAAGALQTPRILLQSNLAGPSGLTGRNLMRHAIDLFVLRRAPRLENAAVSKELGLNDFYEVDGHKLGTVQSFGVPPPGDYLRRQPGLSIWRMLGPLAGPVAKLFAGIPIVAGILEDSPDPDNTVDAPGGRLRVRYRLPDADQRRRVVFREHILRAFRRFSPTRAGGDDRKGLGHVCGTCRFGDDPATSVLDRWNRAHHLDNLYVADASFFPVSSGVNPALTIAANALRLAQHLREVLS